MTNRAAAAWLALALFVGALIAGFVPVHANDVGCGSAFAGEIDKTGAAVARYGDVLNGRSADYEAACADRRGTQRAFVIPLLVIAAVGGGFLLLTARTAAPRTSA
jgi:hypothetical protein